MTEAEERRLRRYNDDQPPDPLAELAVAGPDPRRRTVCVGRDHVYDDTVWIYSVDGDVVMSAEQAIAVGERLITLGRDMLVRNGSTP